MMPGLMVLVHCTSPQWDLSTCEVSCWYLEYFLSYAPDKNQAWKLTKGNNSKSMMPGVMVIVHCTSPQWDLSTCEVSCW